MDINSVVEKIRNDEGQELERIYKAYREEFIKWINKRFSLAEQDAKEIYQDSILILYENAIHDKIKTMGINIKTYLFAIGKNKALEQLRKVQKLVEHKEEELNVPLERPTPYAFDDENLEKETLLVNVEHALEKLGEPCSSLLKQFYYHKRSLDHISQQLNYKNVGTAKNMKYKCLQRLRKLYHQGI